MTVREDRRRKTVQMKQKILKKRLIDFAEEHLFYEIKMLYGVVDMLHKCDMSNMYIYNALLESFVLHASVILDFFYAPEKKNDDARAIHYVKNSAEWKKALPLLNKHFAGFTRKRNKEVMHLSYKRLEVRSHEKRWGSRKITKEISKVVDLFLDHANPQLIHPSLNTLRHGLKRKGGRGLSQNK